MNGILSARGASAASTGTNRRRVPAHLSVSLRRQSLTSQSNPQARDHHDRQHAGIGRPEQPGGTVVSDLSEVNERKPTRSNVQTWFDHSNSHPQVALSHSLEGNDPPYFLPRTSSSGSSDPHDGRPRTTYPQTDIRLLMGRHSATGGSSADEFRSVIDDLTVENKKLKEKLKKIQQPYTPHLDKDRLFEIKIHGLSARKRRQLEDTLRAFTASLDDSSEEDSPKGHSEKHGCQIGDAEHKPSTSSSTSNSRPVDSAYLSMSVCGDTSSANLNQASVPRKATTQSEETNEQNVQDFLHAIPQGMLRKQSLMLTERQKKRLVVQRLEQLFTGKERVAGKSHSQPLQQQEISKSAARADQAAANNLSPLEGLREANILRDTMNLKPKPGKLSVNSSNDSRNTRDNTDSSDDVSTDDASPEQRPTRPLDLDPDRAQNASDNIEYIRHLGLSTPQLLIEDLGDVGADAQGWIYLNLLVNMAQLHIINVTPDFVRHALQDVSEKFQLSEDGKKARWRGGSRGTQLGSSSDSGSRSALNHSSHDSDSLEDGGGKRRRIDSGRFASIPVHPHRSRILPGTPGQSKSFQYRPLFNHRHSSTSDSHSSDDRDSRVSSDDRDSRVGYQDGHASGFGREPRLPHASSGRPRSRSKGRTQRDDGPMVFYSGAPFCTDLSGDRDIIPPLHDPEVGTDGFSDHTRTVLGSKSRPDVSVLSRTTSGSILSSRPFKELVSCRTESSRSSTPDHLESAAKGNILFVDESTSNSLQSLTLQAFEASGLGGTQPADHFAVRVETKRTNIDHPALAPVSKFSAPGSKPMKFLHSIPKAALDSFAQPDILVSEEAITSRFASLTACSSPPTAAAKKSKEELPVKLENVSVKYIHLNPSSLPEPASYHSTFCSSEEDGSECYSSSAGVSHLINHNHNCTSKRGKFTADPNTTGIMPFSSEQSSDGEGRKEEEDDDDDQMKEGEAEAEDEFLDDVSDDSDVSVDMLAYEREKNPEKIALEEQAFEMAIRSP